MDRLQAMKIFERVVEEGGFAAAARAMDMSPPVVTRMVAELEQHLGTRLLHRSRIAAVKIKTARSQVHPRFGHPAHRTRNPFHRRLAVFAGHSSDLH